MAKSMEALLFAFVAAALASWADRAQLLVAMLSARHGRPLLVLAGFALAAAGIAALGAAGGAALHALVDRRAQALLLALALAFAGVVGMLKPDPPGFAARFRGGSFLSALLFGFAFASGSRAQFTAVGLAAWSGLPVLTAIGAAAGMVAAAVPAALLAKRFLELPARPVRIVIAAGFLLAAAITLLNAPAT